MTQLHDLLDSYSAGASDFGRAQLHTLFDFLKRSEERANALQQAYLAQITHLQAELSALRSGSPPPARRVESNVILPAAPKRELKPAPPPKAKAKTSPPVALTVTEFDPEDFN